MNKGILSHACCLGFDTFYRHIISIDSNNLLLSLLPFKEETANTLFIDGWIIITTQTFENEKEKFVQEIQQTLLQNPHTTLSTAITESMTYRTHHAQPSQHCSIYSITPIAWHTMRPTDVHHIVIRRIV